MRGALGFALILVACGGEVATGGDGAIHQFSTHMTWVGRSDVLLLVVDDSAVGDSVMLRETIVNHAIADTIAYVSRPAAYARDEYAWVSIDLRVFVLHPSAPPADALSDSIALVTPHASRADLAVVAASVAQEIERHVALPGQPYPLLAQMSHAYELLTRRRPPANDREARIAASLPLSTGASGIEVNLLSARDDESPLRPTDYASVRFPSALEIGTCGGALPRLESYATSEHILEEIDKSFCSTRNDSPLGDVLVPVGFLDYTCFDPSRPVVRDALGRADCRITFDAASAPECDPRRGWADLPSGLGGCEILQATGETLERCRASFACEGCASAFCLTDSHGGACAAPQFHFTGGAAPTGVGAAHATITCNLEY
jgi:hypothetical protein